MSKLRMKKGNNPDSPAFRIASIAILTALVTVFTIIIRIPIAPTRGYINLGDVAICFAALSFGPFTAAIAGGLGTGIADLLSGYAQWAPISFFIHGLQGYLVGIIIKKAIVGVQDKDTKQNTKSVEESPDNKTVSSSMEEGSVVKNQYFTLPIGRTIAAGFAGVVTMAGLYLLAGSALVGYGAALVEFPGNIIQATVGVFGGLLLTQAVHRAYPPIRNFFW